MSPQKNRESEKSCNTLLQRESGVKPLTVSQVTRIIKEALESLPPLWVEGEVSNLTYHASGHIYFTLKDKNSELKAVVWRSNATRLRFRIEEGMQIIIFGSIRVYEARGYYQISVEHIEPKGVGALAIAFEQLKTRLASEGFFDLSRKKPLPFLPRTIGIVTSPTGAAIRDMLKIILSRFPARIVIYPARVQGEGAAQEISAGIAYFNKTLGADVIITGRGGGSLEDLWAFNEELVARAIFASQIPVISAVGHEIDITISDLVADVRAATPSHAAKLVVPDLEELRETLKNCGSRLILALANKEKSLRRELRSVSRSYVFRNPLEPIREKLQRLDDLYKLARANVTNLFSLRKEKLKSVAVNLDSLSPLRTLSRGYSITTLAGSDLPLKSARSAKVGDTIETTLSDGKLRSIVQ
jgi:exodeoxyribonuclease VII large subunit